MKNPCRVFALLIVLVIAPGASAHAQRVARSAAEPPTAWKTPWAYDGPRGPTHWADLDSAYAMCRNGREQSPIDIRDAVVAPLPALHFDYHEAPLDHLINNGYAVRVNYHAGERPNVLRVGGDAYRLVQFHFHTPSEEYVAGKPYAMEVHLMHKSADGKLAGVVVFLQAGAPNAVVQRIWDHMPLTKGAEHDVPGVEIDPTGLLPADRSYFTYTGSVSAPPCTEGVTWFVLEHPVEISAAQFRAYKRVYSHDVRPLQPANGRVVKRSH